MTHRNILISILLSLSLGTLIAADRPAPAGSPEPAAHDIVTIGSSGLVTGSTL